MHPEVAAAMTAAGLATMRALGLLPPEDDDPGPGDDEPE
jgi:hypothetical protein